MRDHVTRHVSVLKTTAVGGLFFLLPLAVIGILLGPIVPSVLWVATFLRETLGIESAVGYAWLVAVVVLVLLLLCFAAGVVAKLNYGRRMGELAERALTFLFPRYAVYKYQLAEGVGDEALPERARPVLVPVAGVTRLGLEIERTADGVATVYLPGAPDAWAGTTCFVAADRLRPVEAEFGALMATFEKLGRGAGELTEIKKGDL